MWMDPDVAEVGGLLAMTESHQGAVEVGMPAWRVKATFEIGIRTTEHGDVELQRSASQLAWLKHSLGRRPE
jgi:hypothetical protein